MNSRVNISGAIECLFYIFLFLLPWQTRLFIRKDYLDSFHYEFSGISLYISDCVLLLCAALFLFYSIKAIKPENIAIKKYWWLIALFELAVFISIFAAQDKPASIYGYILFLAGVFVFLLNISNIINKIRALSVFAASVCLQSVLGLWQFWSQSTISAKWLGLARHEAFHSGVSVIETAGGGRWLRAYGGLDHPNIFGALMVFGLLAALELYPRLSRGLPGRLFYYLLVGLLGAGLIVSFSRSAWLALAASGSFLFLARPRKKKSLAPLLVLGGITAVLFIVFYANYGDIFKSRLYAQGRLEDKAIEERIDSYSASWALIGDNIFFGVGVRNYGTAMADVYPNGDLADYQPVHNTYLLILAEAGLSALSAFVGLLAYLIFRLSRADRSASLAYLMALCVLMLFDHWLWSLHFGILLFWLLLSFASKEIED